MVAVPTIIIGLFLISAAISNEHRTMKEKREEGIPYKRWSDQSLVMLAVLGLVLFLSSNGFILPYLERRTLPSASFLFLFAVGFRAIWAKSSGKGKIFGIIGFVTVYTYIILGY